MRLSRSFSAIFPIILLSCSPTGLSNATIYTPSQVVLNATSLRGHHIYIRGYLVLTDEGRALWDSREDRERAKLLPGPNDPVWKRCITANYTSSGAKDIGRNTPRLTTVLGRISIFSRREYIDLGACSDIYITIEHATQD